MRKNSKIILNLALVNNPESKYFHFWDARTPREKDYFSHYDYLRDLERDTLSIREYADAETIDGKTDDVRVPDKSYWLVVIRKPKDERDRRCFTSNDPASNFLKLCSMWDKADHIVKTKDNTEMYMYRLE